jgi:hypothetical protein
MRAKSVIGVDEKDTPQNKKPLKGILFDRYHKIPEPTKNKLSPDWKPEYLIQLEKAGNSFAKFIKALLSENSQKINPLALMG